MARGDMADFVSEHSGQFGLAVHQRHQLAGGVDIAARHREGIVHRRIEQADGKARARVAEARLHRDILAHLLDIGRLGPAHRAPEFGKELRVILRPHLRFLGRDRGCVAGDLLRGRAGASGKCQRRCPERENSACQ